jgi:hypothetical protein
MAALTPTRVTLAMWKLSSLHLRKRWNEAKIRRLRRRHLAVSTGDKLQGGVLKLHALDAVRFHVYAGAEDAPSCQLLLCTHMPWCETLIPGRLPQMPQLSKLAQFFLV